jgi:hypothetical protein
MLIRHVQLSDIERVAESIGVTFEGADSGVRFPRVRGRLIPDRTVPRENRPYRRVSASIAFNEGREVFAVCWHGHRDFFRALFAEFPSAVADTMMARYTAENFENVFPDTAYRNVGSRMYPVYASEVCRCGEGSW